MLATVVCKDAPGGMKGFFRDLFALPEIELQRISVPEGDAFYSVTVTEYRGQIPTEETAEKLKRLKGSVIFDINFPCDENTRCLEFQPKTFPALLLFNSFTNYIKELSLSPISSSLTVFDPEGIYSDVIEKAVPLFSKIEIFTKELTTYEKTAEVLFNRYGISLCISDTFSGKAPKSTVVLCPIEVPFCDFFNGILFTLSDHTPPCACKVTGDGTQLPAEYGLLRPGGIDNMLFASALYEKCGVKKLGKLPFKNLRIT